MIRAATATDREPIEQLLRASAVFNLEEIRVALEMFDEATRDGYSLLVAEVDTNVCGYVCAGHTPLTESTWYLYWICVAPAAQRQGVGKALQRHVEQLTRANGGRRLVLETSGRPDYDAARRFYERVGFVRAGFIADFYRPGDDCVIYVKRLD